MPLLTEAEAKEKWCPQPESDHCLASKCMGWRWKDKETERKVYRYKEDHPEMMKHYTGYCGLAGKPEE